MIITARNNKSTLPELLAPAGSFECLVAAVSAGADAIYVGGRRFGARAFAKNFDLPELLDALTYCKLHGVKLYVTVNTLLEDKEISDVVDYARQLWKIGIDALIVSDVGVISAIREALPKMELHASTQMSVHSSLGADAAYDLGCKRVVLARELSLENIKSATENSKTEIEVFLHGALCVSHSGQCLFSSLVGGRSGNRGECAQPCRLPYTTPRGTEYPLSLKDLSLADHIPELIDSGVASLKIEGRMKSAGYVYTVTQIYRRLLDEKRAATKEEKEILRQAFSRGGFTDGYLTARLGSGMLGVRSEGDKEESRKIDEISIPLSKKAVCAKVTLSLGKPAEMTLTDGTRKVTVIGETPVKAESSPLTKEGVCERLSKMGNTYLSLDPSEIDLTLDEGINLSPAALNSLRRSAAEAFCSFGRPEPIGVCTIGATSDAKKPEKSPLTTAEFYSAEEYLKAKALSPEFISGIDRSFVPLFSAPEAIKDAKGVILPAVILDSELSSAKAQLLLARELGATHGVAQNIGQISLLSDMGFTVFGGFRLNITNTLSKKFYQRLGVSELILSPELTLPKARDISGGAITYGRIPLMLTERCFVKDSFGCASCGKASFIDRRGERFPLIREHDHRTVILNSAITYMGDKSAELDSAGLYHRHLLFTNETAEQIISSLDSIAGGKPLAQIAAGEKSPVKVRRMGRRQPTDTTTAATPDKRDVTPKPLGTKPAQNGAKPAQNGTKPAQNSAKFEPIGKKSAKSDDHNQKQGAKNGKSFLAFKKNKKRK